MSTPSTPGPWEISGGALRIFGGSEWIATIQGATPENGLSPTSAKALANARLIAAAPDLLAALASLIDRPLRYVDNRIEIDCNHHADAMTRVRAARAALAKVRA